MYEEIIESIEKGGYSASEREVLKKAFLFAQKAHEGQKRASGEEYFTHPVAVAQILVDLGMDYYTVAAAFLHDVIEDTPVSEGDIKEEFGEEILELVEALRNSIKSSLNLKRKNRRKTSKRFSCRWLRISESSL